MPTFPCEIVESVRGI